jgi:hypothetical protein
MKVKEFKAQFKNWTDKERFRPIDALMRFMTPISAETLMEFQRNWSDPRLTHYNEFVKKQNEEIEKCIALEMTEIGRITREACGLPPLTDETEIPET